MPDFSVRRIDPVMMMNPTSLTLLDRLRSERREDDWTRFVILYQPFIRRFIKLDGALAADADDVCQEVMRKIVTHLPRFERARDGSFRNWLKIITVNEVRLFWRRRMARNKSAMAPTAISLESLADARHELSQLWDREHDAYILNGLQELVKPEFSDTTWRAFELRVFEGKSSDEAAAILGITKNAVDIAKSRVVSRMRRESQGFLDAKP
jgi:RNA polymerase sigma-70 factor, ECF subfamily